MEKDVSLTCAETRSCSYNKTFVFRLFEARHRAKLKTQPKRRVSASVVWFKPAQSVKKSKVSVEGASLNLPVWKYCIDTKHRAERSDLNICTVFEGLLCTRVKEKHKVCRTLRQHEPKPFFILHTAEKNPLVWESEAEDTRSWMRLPAASTSDPDTSWSSWVFLVWGRKNSPAVSFVCIVETLLKIKL